MMSFIVAGSLSLPFNRPEASAFDTACSISRCEPHAGRLQKLADAHVEIFLRSFVLLFPST